MQFPTSVPCLARILKVKFKSSAGIFGPSMGARNREGIGLLYRPARLYIRLEESINWGQEPSRFLCALKVIQSQTYKTNEPIQ